MTGRASCPQCRRPEDQCLCSLMKPVDTEVSVRILQHAGERNHAFNTARIAAKMLTNGRLEIVWPVPGGLVECTPSDAVLLFPRADAVDVTEWTGPLPRELIVLDGTWSQAKRLLTDNPWLQALPAVSINPPEPSRYRIRAEPAPHCLSTLESTAAALQGLEPNNAQIPRLQVAMDALIDNHLAHRVPSEPRRMNRTRLTAWELLADWENVVVVHMETVGVGARIVQWVAERGSGGRFHASLDSEGVPPCRLERLELGEPESLASVKRRWSEFVRPTDHLVSWSPHADSMAQASGLEGRISCLKPLYGQRSKGQRGTLQTVLEREGLESDPPWLAGRSGRRLARAVTVGRWLSKG